MIEVNHLQGHIMAHFIRKPGEYSDTPEFPFLCLLVSGGNSQIVKVESHKKMEILGQTIDDAAGEAMDKCSKVMGFGYPGGPIIDRLARKGNSKSFTFSKPNIPGYNYSFSGLKTSFLYNLRDWVKDDPDFIEHHKEDLCASLERTIVEILMKKLRQAAKDTGISRIAVAGGVSYSLVSYPRLGNAVVSVVTATAPSFWPRVTGVRPHESRAAMMPFSVSSSIEHDPFMVLKTFSMPST